MKIEIVQKLYSFKRLDEVCSAYLTKTNDKDKIFVASGDNIGVETHWIGDFPQIEKINKTAKDLFYSELEKSGLK